MKIRAVLFDLGGTLEEVKVTPESQQRFMKLAQILIGGFIPSISELSPERFCAVVSIGMGKYKEHSIKTNIEASGSEIWGEWVFGSYVEERPIFDLLGDILCDLWESVYFVRSLRSDAEQTLKKLSSMGLRLGIISNTTSYTMPLRQLEMYGIAHLFEVIILSAEDGARKPSPAPFLRAVREMRLTPERCVYVGDQVTRDVAGARAAGFAQAILIQGMVKEQDWSQADAVINMLGDLATKLHM